jgi:hypothetical protein
MLFSRLGFQTGGQVMDAAGGAAYSNVTTVSRMYVPPMIQTLS